MKKTNLLICVFLFLGIILTEAQSSNLVGAAVGTNINVWQYDPITFFVAIQSELHISIDKSNPNNLIMSANTPGSQGYYYSNDGGQTWSGNDGFPNSTGVEGDPSTAIDDNGYMYISTMQTLPPPKSAQPPQNYLLDISADHGATWTLATSSCGANYFDKEMITSYQNNIYCSYTDIGFETINFSSYTGGLSGTFSTSKVLFSTSVNGGGNNVGQGSNIQTGPNGHIYVCWANYPSFSQGSNGLGFSISTDGGSTWSSPGIAFSYTGYDPEYGYNALSHFANTRVDCFPSMAVDKSCLHNGRIYVAFPMEFTSGTYNGDYAIQVRSSDDEGSTWSAATTIRTSRSDSNSFMPWITVDDISGAVYVAYYVTDNSTWSTNTYMAYSTDGGSTFNNIPVSSLSHTLAPINNSEFDPGYSGDYIGIAAHNNIAYPVWMDNTNGTWQAYVAPVNIGLKINSNTTWSSSQEIITNLEITASHTLTISSGVTIEMLTGRHIIVDAGAELVVSGTLTNLGTCGLWGGIQVKGNTSASQIATNQGTVVLNSTSVIEYADTGIATSSGIIKANGALFYNNQADVEFSPYTAPSPLGNYNYCRFTNCTFSLDHFYYDNYITKYPLHPRVMMHQVHGVSFGGNTFENGISLTDLPCINERSTGIYSIDASYRVSDCISISILGCSGTANTFTGFEYGIMATNTNPSYNIQIQGNSFTNNCYDIDIYNINHMAIDNNNFYKTAPVGDCSIEDFSFSPYNIYLDQCTGYNVSGNSLSNSEYSDSYGIIINNSGTANNLINNNSFSGIYVQSQSQGINGGIFPVIEYSPPPIVLNDISVYSGLQYQCNQFNSSVASGVDISVASGLIDPIQGNCTYGYTTANNIFNYSCSSASRSNIYNYPSSLHNINYRWAGSSSNDNPICTSGPVFVYPCAGLTANCTVTTFTLTVASGDLLIAQGVIYHTTLRSQKQSFRHERDSLTQMLARGNTAGLFSTIATGTSTVIQDSLLAPSPYLSDSVLKAAILKTSLPHETLANILIPNTPLDSSVVSTLSSIGLPDTLVARLNEYQSTTVMSPRTELVAGISDFQSLMDYTDNALITALQTDSTIVSPYDSAQAVLKSDTLTLPRLAQLASLQWAAGENTSALVTLDTLHKHDKDSMYSNYYRILPVLMTLSADSNGYLSLLGNLTDSILLEQIAMDTLKPGYANARAVLGFVYNQAFTEPILPLSSGSHRPKKRNSLLITTDAPNSQLSILNSQFNVFPNPANNELNIQYSLDNNIQSVEIELFDEVGNKVLIEQLPVSQTQVTENIANLSPGFYLYTIFANNRAVQRGKLIIAR